MARAPRKTIRAESKPSVTKTTLSLPVELHRRLGALASMRGTSVNALLTTAAAGLVAGFVCYERAPGAQVEPGPVEPAAGADGPPLPPGGPGSARFPGLHPVEPGALGTGLTVPARPPVVVVPGAGMGSKASA